MKLASTRFTVDDQTVDGDSRQQQRLLVSDLQEFIDHDRRQLFKIRQRYQNAIKL
jgi:intein-encoded DNA endonuclease-like protein